MLGNEVKEINPVGLSKEVSISVEDLPGGIYFIILQTGKGYVSDKLIVFK